MDLHESSMAVKSRLCLKCGLKLIEPCTFVCPCPNNNRVAPVDETCLNTLPPRSGCKSKPRAENSCTLCTDIERGKTRVSVQNDPIGVRSTG
jgi:hypothetical protein